jgi:hypothetical protein
MKPQKLSRATRTSQHSHSYWRNRSFGTLKRADLADRGTTMGVDTTRCAGAVIVPPFALSD